ncbi:MAG: hypothetical protein U0Z26_06050 [Anaerolineales bacterium]
MRKFLLISIVVGLLLSACAPSSQPASDNTSPTVDLNLTAAVLVEQTLQAMPSSTPFPSNTPVVIVETNTKAPSSTPSQTLASTSATPTLTGTLETSSTITPTGTLTTPSQTATPTSTSSAGFATTPTETLHPRYYGTLPPNLPFGSIELRNRSKREVYISLQATTNDGYTTILEYPVAGNIKTKAPAGKYIYVVWVGGKKLSGTFSLGKSTDLSITIFKDHVEIKSK